MSSLRLALKQSMLDAGMSPSHGSDMFSNHRRRKKPRKRLPPRKPGDPPRKRGRPRKHPLPEERTEATTSTKDDNDRDTVEAATTTRSASPHSGGDNEESSRTGRSTSAASAIPHDDDDEENEFSSSQEMFGEDDDDDENLFGDDSDDDEEDEVEDDSHGSQDDDNDSGVFSKRKASIADEEEAKEERNRLKLKEKHDEEVEAKVYNTQPKPPPQEHEGHTENSAASKIQLKWKAKKKRVSSSRDGSSATNDSSTSVKQQHRELESSIPKLPPTIVRDETTALSSKSHTTDHEQESSKTAASGEAGTSNATESTKTTATPSKKKTKRPSHVPGPTEEIVQWMTDMQEEEARRNIEQGMRLKVRFATQVKKRDGNVVKRLKWYGGLVTKVSKGGRKVRIKYDDGTSEVSKFPDKDIIVDDTNNGEHHVTADFFFPPKEVGDSEMQIDKEEAVSTPQPKPSTPHASATSAKKEDEEDRREVKDEKEQAPSESLTREETPNLAKTKSSADQKVESRSNDQADVPTTTDDMEALAAAAAERRKKKKLKKKRLLELKKAKEAAAAAAAKSGGDASLLNQPIGSTDEESSASKESSDSTPAASETKVDAPVEKKVVFMNSEAPMEPQKPTRATEVKTPTEKEEGELEEGEIVTPVKDDKSPLDAADKVKEASSEQVMEPAVTPSRSESIVADTKVETETPVMTEMTKEAPSIPATVMESSEKPSQVESSAVLSKKKKKKLVSDTNVQKKDADQDEPLEDTPIKEEDVKVVTTGDDDRVKMKNKRRKKKSKKRALLEAQQGEEVESAVPHKKTKASAMNDQQGQQTDSTPAAAAVVEDVTPTDAVMSSSVSSDPLISNADSVKTRTEAPPTKKLKKKKRALMERESDEVGPTASAVKPKKRKRGDVDAKLGRKSPKPLSRATTPINLPETPKATLASTKKVESAAAGTLAVSEQSAFEKKRKKKPRQKEIMNLAEVAAEHYGTPLPNGEFDVNDSVPRTGRRAAQEANERIASKKEHVILPFHKGKKKRGASAGVVAGADLPQGKGTARRSKDERSDEDEDSPSWVQCDHCSKWRVLPIDFDADKLPKKWYCELNQDPQFASCDAPEQTQQEAKKAWRKAKKKAARLREKMEAAAAAAGNTNTAEATQGDDEPKKSRREGKEKEGRRDSKEGKPRRNRTPIPEISDDSATPSDDSSDPKPKKPGRKPKSTESDEPTEPIKVKGKPGRRRKEVKEDKVKGTKGRGRAANKDDDDDADNLEWVQCEKCQKWRRLPSHISAADLPDIWYCSMKEWDPENANCDAEEDKADPSHREFNVIGAVTGGSKLSYRNLIFGTGKKYNRPVTERQRAAESIFARIPQDGSVDYPVFMYANSSVFASRAKDREEERRGDRYPFLEMMTRSNLWAELHGMSHLIANEDEEEKVPTLVPLAARQPLTFATLSPEMRKEMGDMIHQVVGNVAMREDEILLQAQGQPFGNALPSIWESLRALCTIESVQVLLQDLVEDGRVVCQGSPQNGGVLFCRRPVAPALVPEDSDPPSAAASTTAAAAAVVPDEPRRVSRCMKIAKPWKKRGNFNVNSH